MATLYAQVPDLISWVQSTDTGTGTPAELSPAQLTQALTAASNRVSVFFGSVMDSSVPQAVPPDIFHDLTLDLATFYGWRMYLKGKELPETHPAYLAYVEAMKILVDARDGVLRLDPAAAGGVNEETGLVINRIPRIFTGLDSNTRLGYQGELEADTPPGMWAPSGQDLTGGTVYQG